MLDWLRNIIGYSGPTENPHGLAAETVGLIEHSFSHLKKTDRTIPARAVRYIVDGTDGDVLTFMVAKLPQWYSPPPVLQVELNATRRQLYDRWDLLPAEVLVRFGAVLAASSPGLNQYPLLDIAQKLPWVDTLVVELLGKSGGHSVHGGQDFSIHPMASMARLEALLESAGVARSELVVSAFRSGKPQNRWTSAPDYIGRMPGFGESAARYADLVRGTFRAKSFEHRAHVLRLLEHTTPEQLSAFTEELVELTMDSSRQVRAMALPIARRLGPAALDAAKRAAVEQKPEQRALVLRFIWELDTEEARSFVRERGETDTADGVRKMVQSLRSGAEAAATSAPAPAIADVPVDVSAPLSADSRRALRETIERINDLCKEEKRRFDSSKPPYGGQFDVLTRGDIETIVEQVAGPSLPDKHKVRRFVRLINYSYQDRALKLLNAWLGREDVRLTHVVRLLMSIGSIDPCKDAHWQFGHISQPVLSELGRSGRASLLELQSICEAIGMPADAVTKNWFSSYGRPIAHGWPDEAVWPYFAKHRAAIDEALRPSSKHEYWYSRERVFDALATFPQVPGDLVPLMLELALGSSKSERVAAQRVLDRLPSKTDHIIDALASGKSEQRTAAANWLARLKCTEAVPALEKALAKEKHDAAAGALMSALEALGVPVDRFIDRSKLAKDAEKGLAKGVPADLTWFPFDLLPAAHWSDNGERVPEQVVRWLVVQSCKLKSPEPGGVLQRYCAALRAPDREALGLFALNAWLKEDVKPIPRADAEQRARSMAQGTFRSIKQYPKYHENSPYKDLSEQQLYEAYLPNQLRTAAGSAIGSKGVLAVAAACGGSEVAPVVHRYVKEWYGTRAAQGKALIQMLAWVDHPTAIQLVLSIGSRFRTKGFQEEATRQAQLLAERRGWTLDELSDRTIPTAGFDERGEATIDYGERTFTARLTADFDVKLYTSEGKKIASLPEARKDEDEARVKEAKKQFSAARKELKGVLALQKDRLYEGLCTERRWRFGDWSLYLNRHPIVRSYCQRLVWAADPTGKPRIAFRPLDDGSLTDLDDNTVTLAADDQVTLAHDSNTDPAICGRWLEHLKDYKIEPLFQQFGKGMYKLPDDKTDSTGIDDFRGHLLMAFTLRGRAGKLGYTRGAAGDGGWFVSYDKRFPSLGIEATIEFTGSPLPEENRQVALTSLWFARAAPDAPRYGQQRLSLGEVPAVLLSECWNDMRLMAADGTGFDPDWERKAQY